MLYHSTRDKNKEVGFIAAVLNGLAPDGGLYLPKNMECSPVEWSGDYAEFAARLLAPFTAPDLGRVETLALTRRAFTFPVQWREISRRRYQLELFHGPSASFKDFGAQFLAQVIASIPAEKERLILVATSGDTGSAVAAAFHNQPNTQVVILYPKGRVSVRQAHQLSCWGGNIKTLAVAGSFDDCQALVKQCFKEKSIKDRFTLTTANSINIGRLLPQVVYFAYNSLLCDRLHKKPMNLIIPTGNCGHLTAACWAKKLGYPIGEIIAAQNANRPIVDYVSIGTISDSPSMETLANAMDVGSPSNFARLKALYPSWEEFCQNVQAYSLSDQEIKNNIKNCHDKTEVPICPHTATAYAGLPPLEEDDRPWTFVATADPAKFESIVEPIIGHELPLPVELEAQLKKPVQAIDVAAEINAVVYEVLGGSARKRA